MLVTYMYGDKEYYDINGVMILSKLSKTQSKKIMREYMVDTIEYLNRHLYSRDSVIEFCNLINLRDEVSLRLMNHRADMGATESSTESSSI
jgi:hypothetical protein